MNLSIPCGLSTRFFTTVLFLTGFGVAHAQLTLPKTLDDPGRLPEITYTIGDRNNDDSIDFDYSDSASLTLAGECDSSQTIVVNGGKQTVLNLFRVEFSGATEGVLYGESETASISISQDGKTTVTATPFAYELADHLTVWASLCPDGLKFDYSNLRLEARISVPDVRKTSYGHTGTPISFSSDEITAAQGTRLAIVQTEGGAREQFSVADNADAAALAAALSSASDSLSISTHGEPQDDDSLLVYGNEGFQITEGQSPTITNTLYGELVLNGNNNAEWSTKFSEDMALPTVAQFLATKALRVGESNSIVTADSGELLSIRYGETNGQENKTILIFEIEVEANHENYRIRMQYNDTGHDNSGLTDLAGNAYEGENAHNGFVDTTNLSVAALRKQGILVYPNPVITQLHLVYPSATQATYTVYDLTGKTRSTHHASGQTHQLNVSSLAKGVYLLKAQHGNQTGVFRFVKE